MDISEFAFKLLLLFFPGIICAFLVDQLTVHRPRETFFFLMQSFVFGLISYFSYWTVLRIFAMFFPGRINPSLNFLRALTDSNVTYSFREIVFVTVCAVVIGLFVTVASRHKWVNRVAQKIRLTKKFGELDVWGYFMNVKEIEWVTVRDHSNDLILDGWVQAFSDDSKDAEILLRDVSVYKNSTGERLYQIGAMYLSRNRQDISIECRTIPVDDVVKWKEEKDEQSEGNTEAIASSNKHKRGTGEERRSESETDDATTTSA